MVTRRLDYTYDFIGNRLSRTVFDGVDTTTTAYVYNEANQLVSSQTGAEDPLAFTYDPAGNLVDDGVNSYRYDAADRLVGQLDGETGIASSYAYNGLGDRAGQTVNGATTDYLLDLNGGLTQVLRAATDAEDTWYLHGADILGQQGDGVWSYLGYDGLGSARQMYDSVGDVAWATNYAPYGNPFEQYVEVPTALGFIGEFPIRVVYCSCVPGSTIPISVGLWFRIYGKVTEHIHNHLTNTAMPWVE